MCDISDLCDQKLYEHLYFVVDDNKTKILALNSFLSLLDQQFSIIILSFQTNYWAEINQEVIIIVFLIPSPTAIYFIALIYPIDPTTACSNESLIRFINFVIFIAFITLFG